MSEVENDPPGMRSYEWHVRNRLRLVNEVEALVEAHDVVVGGEGDRLARYSGEGILVDSGVLELLLAYAVEGFEARKRAEGKV